MIITIWKLYPTPKLLRIKLKIIILLAVRELVNLCHQSLFNLLLFKSGLKKLRRLIKFVGIISLLLFGSGSR